MDTQQARSRLEELLAELDDSAAVVRSDGGAETGELAAGDQEASDFAATVVDADRDVASREVIEAQRERVTDALERLDAGSYGRCVVCGEAIPAERLEARPEVARCIEDQAKYEAAH